MKKSLNHFYIVEKGDSLESIANKYNKTPIEILIKNTVTPDMIKEGTVLFINF